MKQFKPLLAKSYDRKRYPANPPDYALLIQHSRDVAMACKSLANISGRLALFNAELDSNMFQRFERILLANGWIQDLGKANSHFQEMVTKQDGLIQLIRHETISGLLACFEENISAWLEPLGQDKWIALWGAIGHHRKFDEDTMPKQVAALTVHLKHPDFKTILKEIGKDLTLDEPPEFEHDLIIGRTHRESCDFPARESLIDLIDIFETQEADFKHETDRRFVALVKGFGMAADVAASAVARRDESAQLYSLSRFITTELSIGLSPEDLKQLIKVWAENAELPPGFEPRDFQNNVAASNALLTFAEAGCGSGKSLAAYLWALRWCEKVTQEGRNNFRLFFCLPTTGTTTEHFKDYALESGIPVNLAHSRSSVDLQTMAETAHQEEGGEEDNVIEAAQNVLKAEQDKIEALSLWSTPLVVTTADTVLGLMANARRSIYSLPAIMQSVIVFDEVHAFDDYLFGHLLVFLKNFPQLPILLMTASLPEGRRRALEKVRPDLRPVPGLKEFEDLPRYRIQHPAEQEVVWNVVDECINNLSKNNQGKVLWVRNRVDWANETYRQARTRFHNVPVSVYHSRLRYKDRSIRHRHVIDTFKATNQPAILIATQVAKMSLDLSADLLITDIAPVPSLIQRLGRLNRRAKPEKPGVPKIALICSLPKTKRDVYAPYKKEDLEAAEVWIKRLEDLNRSLSQTDLAQQFKDPTDDSEYDYAKAEERACFFSGLWRTRPGMTRGEGYTIPVILERDLKKCNDFRYGEPSPDWLRKHEVAIPIKEAALKWQRVAGIRVAPDDAVSYDQYYENESEKNTYEGTGAAWL